MRLHCHFPSPIFANKSSIKRRYIVLADSSQSQLPPLRNPKPFLAPPPPPPPPPSPSPPKQSTPLPLLPKPSPLQFPPIPIDSTPPFVKLFRTLSQSTSIQESHLQKENGSASESAQVMVEYYNPKPGDLVVGVVLSGNENKIDLSIGSDMLGSMLTKEALPFCEEEMNGLVCDLNEEREKGLFDNGKVGIVRDEVGFREKGEEGRKVESGTVVFAEVFRRSLGGRPFLSPRRHSRRIAWQHTRN